ncbi:hypothetical protein [Azospirillum argentinense]
MNLTFVLFISVNGSQHSMSYADFVAILLTAIAVIVASLGVGVAVLAIWGYQTISKNTKDAADKKASEVAGIKIDYHLNGEAFERQLRELIAKVQAEQSVQSIQSDSAQRAEGEKENVSSGNDIPAYPGAERGC